MSRLNNGMVSDNTTREGLIQCYGNAGFSIGVFSCPGRCSERNEARAQHRDKKVHGRASRINPFKRSVLRTKSNNDTSLVIANSYSDGGTLLLSADGGKQG